MLSFWACVWELLVTRLSINNNNQFEKLQVDTSSRHFYEKFESSFSGHFYNGFVHFKFINSFSVSPQFILCSSHRSNKKQTSCFVWIITAICFVVKFLVRSHCQISTFEWPSSCQLIWTSFRKCSSSYSLVVECSSARKSSHFATIGKDLCFTQPSTCFLVLSIAKSNASLLLQVRSSRSFLMKTFTSAANFEITNNRRSL